MLLQARTIQFYSQLSLILSVMAAAIFLLGLSGWVFNLTLLPYFDRGADSIEPVSCIAGLMLVISKFAIRRHASYNYLHVFIAIIPFIIALISIIHSISGSTSDGLHGFHPNQNVQSTTDTGGIRFSNNILFLVTSIGLMFDFKNTRNIRRSQFTSLLVIYFCSFLLLGYLLRSEAMTNSGGIFHVPLPALLGLLLLNLAILTQTAEHGIMLFYRQNSPVVRIQFWLLIQTILPLVLIGWLRFKGEEFGLYNSKLGIAIMIGSFIAVLVVVITRSAFRLLKMEKTNQQLVNQLQTQKAEFETILNRTSDGVYTLDNQLRITSANLKALQSVNKSNEEVIGAHVSSVFKDPELGRMYTETLEKALAAQDKIETIVHSKLLNRWFLNTIFPTKNGITTFYKDITAQKLAEIEVNQSKENFRGLVENLKDVVIRVDINGKTAYISPEKSDHTDTVRKQLSEWFKNYLQQQNHTQTPAASDGPEGKIYKEVECIIFDGAELVFEVRYTPEFNMEGQLTSFLAICRNVTEQARVRDERERLNSIIQHMTAMVAQANENLESTYINSAGKEMLGIDPDTPLPRVHLSEYTTSENARFMEEVALPVALENGTWMGESVLVNKTGKIIPVMLILIVHRDKEGKFSYLSSVAYDLTDIKKTETALRESEKRWQFAVDGSNLGLWDWNINSNLTFYSRQWKLLLGYAEHEIGNTPVEFENRLHPEDRERVIQELVAYFQGTTSSYDTVLRLRKKDGSYLYVRDRGMITDYNPDGTPARMIGTHSDVTNEYSQADMLRRSKEELRSLAGHLQNLREEERLKLSRMMQEEVGQQLSSLKMTFSSFDNAEQLPAGDVINKVGKAQQTLENAIRIVKQISTELRPTMIDDLGLVASLQALTAEFKSRFNIRIRFSSIFDNLETSGKAALCIYRVYQEALSNIARHSGATMVAVRLTISEDGRLILAIKDDGVGFDVADREFEHKFGLVQIRERMLMIDGDMQISSAPGSGTVLKVSAPMTLED